MMTCQEMIDFLLDYVEGQLPADQAQTIDRHLALCPECEAYLTSYKSTVKLSHLLCDDMNEAAEPMPEELVTAIMNAHRASR